MALAYSRLEPFTSCPDGGMALHFSRIAPGTEELEIWSASEGGFSFVISNESQWSWTSREAWLCSFLALHRFQQTRHPGRWITL
jgi:hypothetical protein